MSDFTYNWARFARNRRNLGLLKISYIYVLFLAKRTKMNRTLLTKFPDLSLFKLISPKQIPNLTCLGGDDGGKWGGGEGDEEGGGELRLLFQGVNC